MRHSALDESRELIRAGKIDEGRARLLSKLEGLERGDLQRAHTMLGLSHYFQGAADQALPWFERAAEGSEVPEDWFNLAMACVKSGDVERGMAMYQRMFDLSYKHQNAAETSTLFQKKLMFVQLLAGTGHYDERGLTILAQLVPFYTTYHVTDPTWWHIRGVPAYEEVMELMLTFYHRLGKTRAEWEAFCDSVIAEVDGEGKAFGQGIKERWVDTAP